MEKFLKRPNLPTELGVSREWGLPPKPTRKPTVEDVRAIAAMQEDPRETLRKLREAVPLADRETLDFIIRS